MVNNYILLTTKLFAPLGAVLGPDLVMPNWNQPNTLKGYFLAVFFLFIAVTAVKTSTKKLINSAFKSQITFCNYLLDSAAIAGRGGGGGGGGGGHGGLFTRKIRGHDSFQVFSFEILKIND